MTKFHARLRLVLCFTVLIMTFAWNVARSTARAPNDEVNHYLSVGALCAEGQHCPLVGPAIAPYDLNLGPVYYWFLATCQLFSPEPSLILMFAIGFHAIAAVALTWMGIELFGALGGFLAGALLGLAPAIVSLHPSEAHVAFAIAPMTGAIISARSWLVTERSIWVLWSSIFATLALQLHAMLILPILGALGVAIYYRRLCSTRMWLVSAAIFVLPWIPEIARHFGRGWPNLSLSHLPVDSQVIQYAGPWDLWSTNLGYPIEAIVIGIISVGYSLLRVKYSRPEDQRFWALVLATIVPGLAFSMAWIPNLNVRYRIVFYPAAVLLIVHGVQFVWDRASNNEWRREIGTLVALFIVGRALLSIEASADIKPRQFPRTGIWHHEAREILNKLRERGFSGADLHQRVHGAQWMPGLQLIPYLDAYVLPPTDNPAPAGEHVALCAGGLQVYKRSLAPLHVTVDDCFQDSNSAPFRAASQLYGDANADAIPDHLMKGPDGTFIAWPGAPNAGSDPMRMRQWRKCWAETTRGEIRTRLGAGSVGHRLTIGFSPDLKIQVSVADRPLSPIDVQEGFPGFHVARFEAPIEQEIVIQIRGASREAFFDVWEEPSACRQKVTPDEG